MQSPDRFVLPKSGFLGSETGDLSRPPYTIVYRVGQLEFSVGSLYNMLDILILKINIP